MTPGFPQSLGPQLAPSAGLFHSEAVRIERPRLAKKPSRRATREEGKVGFGEQIVGPFCTAVRSEVELNFGCQRAELLLAVE